MKPAFRLTPVIAALGVAAGLTFAAGAQAQTIKIGVVGPTTGPVTQYGDMVREGVDTAVERINAAGGVNGKKLETVVIDDGCEPKQGPVAANRVVNSKIGFVVGHVCSGATIAAADVYNNEGVVMVTLSATSPALTDGKNYEFIFRTIGRDDQQGPAAAKFVLEKLCRRRSPCCMTSSPTARHRHRGQERPREGRHPGRDLRRHQRRRQRLLRRHHQAQERRRGLRLLRRLPPRNGPAAAPGGRTGREGQVDGSGRHGQPGHQRHRRRRRRGHAADAAGGLQPERRQRRDREGLPGQEAQRRGRLPDDRLHGHSWPSPTASRALAARIRPRSPSSCTPTRSTPRSARSPGTSRAT